MNDPLRPPVLVLDDDPTGTQAAADVPVLLRPADVSPTLGGRPAAYLLTNTRALGREEAVALVAAARHRAGPGVELVLRGDSTLRGHVFPEMRALGLDEAVGLIVPAFPAAGRVTLGGVHYLTTGGAPVNVADTEFARDPVFGFSARTMREWVAELGGERPVELVGPAAPGDERADAIRDALLGTPDGGIVVPDVCEDTDFAPIMAGLRAARLRGRRVVVRCAAPLAALIAGVPGRLVPPSEAGATRLLIVCGSHTAAATAQLDGVRDLTPPHLVVPTDALFGEARQDAVRSVVEAARGQLAGTGVTVVTTERRRRPEHGALSDGATVMAGLMAVTRCLAPEVDAIVAKGGITSAEVVTSGLGASEATVLGQIEVGISLWQVGDVPVAVVPGNIGDAGTLARMVRYFTGG
ncbi:four-carbon acid sugar kinase family protein [Rugosimonospora acidiphila]|uniref:Four-carbon acid sugar kinase family protein n=1 Tax=Rugosimonospora acidiphila TaxID=556531 RepID=A0ABP9RWR6_9ACTN